MKAKIKGWKSTLPDNVVNTGGVIEADSIEIIDESKKLKTFDFGILPETGGGHICIGKNVYNESGNVGEANNPEIYTILGNLKDLIAAMQKVKDGKTEVFNNKAQNQKFWAELSAFRENDILLRVEKHPYDGPNTLIRKTDFFNFCAQGIALVGKG